MSNLKPKALKVEEKRGEAVDDNKVSLGDLKAKKIKLGAIDTLVEGFATSIQYQGYDPIQFFEVLKNIATQNGISAEQMQGDLVLACTILFTRGAAITKDKVKARTSTEGYDLLSAFIARWGIVTGNPNGATEVTVARMCGTVVHIAVNVANALLKKNLLRTTTDPVPGLVPAFCQPIMASAIPKDRPNLFSVFKVWSGKFSAVISTGGSKPGRGNQNTDYVTVTFNSGYYNEDERAEIMRSAYLGTPLSYYESIGILGCAWCAYVTFDDKIAAYINKFAKQASVSKGLIKNGSDNGILNAFTKILVDAGVIS
jgi:hypothetical protein